MGTDSPNREARVPLPPSAPGRSASLSAVSWEEYEAAVQATVACFQQAGLRMRTMPEPDASGLALRYTVWLTGEAGEDARISSVTQECEDRDLTHIEKARADQLRPTDEQLAAARAAMAECLITAGVPAESVDQNRLLDAEAVSPGTAYPDCATSVAKQYRIPSFGG